MWKIDDEERTGFVFVTHDQDAHVWHIQNLKQKFKESTQEIEVGDAVWIPDTREGYVAASVVSMNDIAWKNMQHQ